MDWSSGRDNSIHVPRVNSKTFSPILYVGMHYTTHSAVVLSKGECSCGKAGVNTGAIED